MGGQILARGAKLTSSLNGIRRNAMQYARTKPHLFREEQRDACLATTNFEIHERVFRVNFDFQHFNEILTATNIRAESLI